MTMTKEGLILRLRKIEGQVKGLQRMLEEGRDCKEVIAQVMAVRSGVDQVGLLVLEHEIGRCLGAAARADPGVAAALQEALRIWTKFSPPGEVSS